MIKDFGPFTIVRTPIQPREGAPPELVGMSLIHAVDPDGKTWQDIYGEFARFDGPSFIDADYPHFGAVTPDGRIRIVYDDPSKILPDEGGRVIASDEEIPLEHTYDPASNGIWEPVPEPVKVVSKAQAKLALLEADLLNGVEAALSAMEGVDGQRARIEWSDRVEFHRDHQFIGLLAGQMGLSDQQVDDLFERASQL